MSYQSLNRIRPEKIAAILDMAVNAIWGWARVDKQVEYCCCKRRLNPTRFQPFETGHVVRCIVKDEHYWHKRRAASRALRIQLSYKQIEREFRVRVGV